MKYNPRSESEINDAIRLLRSGLEDSSGNGVVIYPLLIVAIEWASGVDTKFPELLRMLAAEYGQPDPDTPSESKP